MTDRDDLAVKLETARAQLRRHLAACQCCREAPIACRCPDCLAAPTMHACPTGVELNDDVHQAECRIKARILRMRGDLERARRLEETIALVDAVRSRRIDA
jgi:hypothetical protein